MSSSSLAVARELELWFGGLFTAPELAAAELLLELSVAEGSAAGGGKAEAASSRTTATATTSSPRSVSTCCEVIFDDEEEQEQEQARKVPVVAMELDRRTTKRYRLLSELYAATSTSSGPAAKKMKMDYAGVDQPGSSWREEAAAAAAAR